MPRVISIHSFRGGTGKSNTTANVAYEIARRGHRVGIIDTDIQSPGIHVLFGFDSANAQFALNDYLWGKCEIDKAAYDVTPPEMTPVRGAPGSPAIFLIPSSIRTGEIAKVLREGYDVSRLNDGIQQAIEKLDLQYLLIDTHPGVNEETLLSIAISDVLILVMRPDQQDYQGSVVTLDLARRLAVGRIVIIVNKTPGRMDVDAVRKKVEATFQAPVVAVVPLNEDMVYLASQKIFAQEFPEHELTRIYQQVAAMLAA